MRPKKCPKFPIESRLQTTFLLSIKLHDDIEKILYFFVSRRLFHRADTKMRTSIVQTQNDLSKSINPDLCAQPRPSNSDPTPTKNKKEASHAI